jgi:hypothetical protein
MFGYFGTNQGVAELVMPKAAKAGHLCIGLNFPNSIHYMGEFIETLEKEPKTELNLWSHSDILCLIHL